MLRQFQKLSDDYEYAIVCWGQSNNRPWGNRLKEGEVEAPHLALPRRGFEGTKWEIDATGSKLLRSLATPATTYWPATGATAHIDGEHNTDGSGRILVGVKGVDVVPISGSGSTTTVTITNNWIGAGTPGAVVGDWIIFYNAQHSEVEGLPRQLTGATNVLSSDPTVFTWLDPLPNTVGGAGSVDYFVIVDKDWIMTPGEHEGKYLAENSDPFNEWPKKYAKVTSNGYYMLHYEGGVTGTTESNDDKYYVALANADLTVGGEAKILVDQTTSGSREFKDGYWRPGKVDSPRVGLGKILDGTSLETTDPLYSTTRKARLRVRWDAPPPILTQLHKTVATPSGSSVVETTSFDTGYWVYRDYDKWATYDVIRALVPYQPEEPGPYPSGTPKVTGQEVPAGITSYEDLGLWQDWNFWEGIFGPGDSDTWPSIESSTDTPLVVRGFAEGATLADPAIIRLSDDSESSNVNKVLTPSLYKGKWVSWGPTNQKWKVKDNTAHSITLEPKILAGSYTDPVATNPLTIGFGPPGEATSVSATGPHMTKTGGLWEVNMWVGGYLVCGESWGRVASNTETTITLDASGWQGGTPASPLTYEVWQPHLHDNPNANIPGFRYPTHDMLPGGLGNNGKILNRPRNNTASIYTFTQTSYRDGDPTGNNCRFGYITNLAWTLSAYIGRRVNVIHLGVNSSSIAMRNAQQVFGFGDSTTNTNQLGWFDADENLDWTPANPRGNAARLQKMIETVSKNATSIEGSKPVKVIGIFGMQGEGDALKASARRMYGTTLREFYQWLRQLIHNAGMSLWAPNRIPVCHGKITKEVWSIAGVSYPQTGFVPIGDLGEDKDEEVNAGVAELVREDPYATTIEVDDLEKMGANGSQEPLGVDPLHFNGKSEAKIGQRHAEAWAAVLQRANEANPTFDSPTLKELRARVLNIAQRNTTATDVGITSVVNEAINDAYHAFINFIGDIAWWLVMQKTLTLTDATGPKTKTRMPSEVRRLLSVRSSTDPLQSYEWTMRGFSDNGRMLVTFYQTLDSNPVFEYVYQPSDMVADDDRPVLPREYVEAVAVSAARRLLSNSGNVALEQKVLGRETELMHRSQEHAMKVDRGNRQRIAGNRGHGGLSTSLRPWLTGVPNFRRY